MILPSYMSSLCLYSSMIKSVVKDGASSFLASFRVCYVNDILVVMTHRLSSIMLIYLDDLMNKLTKKLK